jgi:hypothetical protein
LIQANPNVIENIIEIYYYYYSYSCYSNTKEEKRELAFKILSNIALPPFAKLLGYNNTKDI